MQRAATAALACSLAAALGCGGALTRAPEPPALQGNLLANPGFESGEAGWTYPVESPYWGRFEVVQAPVRSGRGAAHLRLRAGSDDRSRAVWILGVMQELSPERFPDVVVGFYRVESWEKDTDATALYLQAVAIVWDQRAPLVVDPGNPAANAGLTNYQLRFYLAGISEPPFLLRNAKVAFVAKGPPALGRWTRFEIPLREEFERQWGAVPAGYEKLRVLFEVRFDQRPPGSEVEADVYLDDLYLGYADAS